MLLLPLHVHKSFLILYFPQFPTKKKRMKINEILPFLAYVYIHDEDVGVLAESLHLVTDQWIQYKLGKQYLRKKVTQPWESNPGPTPVWGELASIIVSVAFI